MMCRVRSAAAAMISSGDGDQLPARGVVLADPGLVVAQMVEPLDQLHVARRGRAVGFSPTRWNGARKMPNFIPR